MGGQKQRFATVKGGSSKILFNSSIGDTTWWMVTSRSCIAWELVNKEDDVNSGMDELAKEVVMEEEGG